METLTGCENLVSEYREPDDSEDCSRQRAVNVGMSPELVSRIDHFVETDHVHYDNRSHLIREIILEKLDEWESEYRDEND